MKFYTFRQNNSGGRFHLDALRGQGVMTFVEAPDAKTANEIALDHGIYFDGCQVGWDCPCCGDRWYEQDDDDDATEVETIEELQVFDGYGTTGIAHAEPYFLADEGPSYCVITLDGKVHNFGVRT